MRTVVDDVASALDKSKSKWTVRVEIASETHPLTGLIRIYAVWPNGQRDYPVGQLWRGPTYERRPLPRVR